MAGGEAKARAALYERLLARRPEIEQSLHTRVYALANPAEALESEYRDGLRAAVTSALDYGLEIVRLGGERAPPIPAPLLTQVRLAARNQIGLDTVLRRYFAGYNLLNDFLLGEAAPAGLATAANLQRLVRSHAALFDRLLATISEEYTREEQIRPPYSLERRRAERIERLLAGELVDAPEFEYDFDATHVGLIATGDGAAGAMRGLARSLDCQLLLISRGEEVVWAWLGSRRGIAPEALQRRARSQSPEIVLAFGEPGQGLTGWRRTHSQARAALPIALRSPGTPIRYSGVAVLASMLQDELLSTSLRELYLEPLEQERDGGEVARQTLRAYFATGRNGASAAAALGVSRQAISKRLRAIEGHLGCTLDTCAAELEAALKIAELDEPHGSTCSRSIVNAEVPRVVT